MLSQPLGVAPVGDWRYGLQSHAGAVKYPGWAVLGGDERPRVEPLTIGSSIEIPTNPFEPQRHQDTEKAGPSWLRGEFAGCFEPETRKPEKIRGRFS